MNNSMYQRPEGRRTGTGARDWICIPCICVPQMNDWLTDWQSLCLARCTKQQWLTKSDTRGYGNVKTFGDTSVYFASEQENCMNMMNTIGCERVIARGMGYVWWIIIIYSGHEWESLRGYATSLEMYHWYLFGVFFAGNGEAACPICYT